MKVMLTAFGVAIIIAVVADIGLDQIGFSSADRQTSPENVRLD